MRWSGLVWATGRGLALSALLLGCQRAPRKPATDAGPARVVDAAVGDAARPDAAPRDATVDAHPIPAPGSPRQIKVGRRIGPARRHSSHCGETFCDDQGNCFPGRCP